MASTSFNKAYERCTKQDQILAAEFQESNLSFAATSYGIYMCEYCNSRRMVHTVSLTDCVPGETPSLSGLPGHYRVILQVVTYDSELELALILILLKAIAL